MEQGTLDLNRLEDAVRREAHVDYFGHFNVVRRIVLSLGSAILMLSFVIPLLTGEPIYRRGHALPFWIRLGGAILLVTAGEFFGQRRQRRAVRDPRAFAETMKHEFDVATGPHWVRTTTLRGILLALGIGIPMGLLLLFFPGPDGGAFAERLRDVGYFELGTFAWAIPTAFAIRWLSMKSTLRFAGSETRSPSTRHG